MEQDVVEDSLYRHFFLGDYLVSAQISLNFFVAQGKIIGRVRVRNVFHFLACYFEIFQAGLARWMLLSIRAREVYCFLAYHLPIFVE